MIESAVDRTQAQCNIVVSSLEPSTPQAEKKGPHFITDGLPRLSKKNSRQKSDMPFISIDSEFNFGGSEEKSSKRKINFDPLI